MKSVKWAFAPIIAMTVLCGGCNSQQSGVQQSHTVTVGAGGVIRPAAPAATTVLPSSPSQPAAVAVSVPAAPPTIAAAAPSNAQSVAITVASGKTTELVKSIFVNPDCTSKGLNTVHITQKPINGAATVVPRDGYTSFPPSNPYRLAIR